MCFAYFLLGFHNSHLLICQWKPCALCALCHSRGSPCLDEHGAEIRHVVCTEGHAVCYPCVASFLSSQAQAPDKTMIMEDWKASKVIHCAERNEILGSSLPASPRASSGC